MKLLLFILFTSFSITAQPNLDSLLTADQNDNPKAQIEILKNLCWEFRSKAPDKAIQYGLAALNKMEVFNEPKFKSETLNFLGVIYGNLGTLDTAYYYYKQAIEVAKINNDPAQIAYSLNNIGDYYYKNALFSMALEKIFSAYEIFEKINHQQGMAYCLNDIGEIYVKQNDFDKALEYFSRSGSIRHDRHDQRGYAKSLINIASVYEKTSSYEKAMKTYEDALTECSQSEYTKGTSWALAGIGDVHFNKEEFQKALEYRFKSLEIDLQIGNKYGEIINYNQIGLIYLKLSNLTKAKEYFNIAKNESSSTGHLDQLMITYDYLRSLELIKNNHINAYEYFAKHEILKDSIFSHDNANMIADLQTAFATERKDRENEILKRDIEFEKDTNNYLILISLLIFIGAALFVSKYKTEKKANQLLNELNSSKDKFLSIIAHDLKNPFGAVSNIAEYLHSDYEDISDVERKELIASLSEASKEIQNLLIDLLTWARTQRGDIRIRKSNLNLHSVLSLITKSYSLFAKNKNIKLSINCSKDLEMVGDKSILETVVGNLVNNAIKFSHPNNEVIIAANKADENIIISVTDFGKGMAQSTIDNIFKLDANLSTTGTNDEKGTGLGLKICKEFISLHGGDIEVVSEVSKGSKFIIRIPVL